MGTPLTKTSSQEEWEVVKGRRRSRQAPESAGDAVSPCALPPPPFWVGGLKGKRRVDWGVEGNNSLPLLLLVGERK